MSTGIVERVGRALRRLWSPAAPTMSGSAERAWQAWEYAVADGLAATLAANVPSGDRNSEISSPEWITTIAADLWQPHGTAHPTFAAALAACWEARQPSTPQAESAIVAERCVVPPGIPWPPSPARAAKIDAALVALPERHRHTLHLRETERLTHAEIAARLGYQRTTTVRALLARAAWLRGLAIARCWTR